ncbi:MAG: flippase-like domain-containing protein [Nitrososphaerota archaeon]|jgi:uncharacterized protein (TIRG00374 family)|uniref:lysylphosphatidylglycerol synthase transmembrane domain-containing protein n=1 Tax=Candidatus Bathycorpusculum sp. TaxID=2994959 RepID=UPI0028208FFB|nr:flippase-like domain-containing protein [Candidatus Termitimicrobium sp.]MCL2432767.1 flippase-like domain-containing protein [Candidatus Termitimicrobium sp.]MDR0492953.1 flippase-like domain-containing protein [Nitrososphaerota archaeon]
MEPTKKNLQSKVSIAILIVGLAAFIAYFAFFIDPRQVAQSITQTNLAIYSVAFATYMLFTLCSALVWRSLLSSLSVKITTSKAFLYTWTGLFFEATIPQLGWSAEVSKTYLLTKDSKVETGKVGASVVGQKILSMTITITALSIGLGLLLFRHSLNFIVTLLIGMTLGLSILTLVIVYYVSFKPSATKTLLHWAIKIAQFFRKSWNPQNFQTKAEEMLNDFHISIAQLKANPKALIAPVVYGLVGFIFEISVLFITFAALGHPVPVDVVLIVFTLTGTLQTVGPLFFPELVMTLTLTTLFGDPAVAFSAALLSRVVTLWFRLVVSCGALQLAGIKIIRTNKKQSGIIDV